MRSLPSAAAGNSVRMRAHHCDFTRAGEFSLLGLITAAHARAARELRQTDPAMLAGQAEEREARGFIVLRALDPKGQSRVQIEASSAIIPNPADPFEAGMRTKIQQGCVFDQKVLAGRRAGRLHLLEMRRQSFFKTQSWIVQQTISRFQLAPLRESARQRAARARRQSRGHLNETTHASA